MVIASFSRRAVSQWEGRYWFARAALLAVLAGNGAVHAADAQEAAAQRPLDLSLSRGVRSRPCALTTPGERCVDRQAYGIGYEARRLGASRDDAASAAGQSNSASIGASATDQRGAADRPVGGGNRRGSGRYGRR